MKFYNLIIMFVMLLGSTFVNATNTPTVSQVESSIASGNYTEARKQLGEVLRTNPDSYVANRYMFEIVKIENGRDNVYTVEYKLYEDRVNKITEQIKQRKLDEAKAIKDAKKEALKRTTLYSLFWIIFVLALSFLTFLGYGKYKIYQYNKEEKKKFEIWSSKATADMLDIEVGLNKVSVANLNSSSAHLIAPLMEDNTDALIQVLKSDVNKKAIEKHIGNAKQFLRKHGIDI